MAKIHIFSDDDMATLRAMAEDYRNQRFNFIPRRVGDYMPGDDQYTPDVHIALPTDTHGIAGLRRAAGTGSGTGTSSEGDGPSEDDAPGSGPCLLYTIREGLLVPLGINSVTVYNLSETPIPKDWITVKRTKLGLWVAKSHSWIWRVTAKAHTAPNTVGLFDCMSGSSGGTVAFAGVSAYVRNGACYSGLEYLLGNVGYAQEILDPATKLYSRADSDLTVGTTLAVPIIKVDGTELGFDVTGRVTFADIPAGSLLVVSRISDQWEITNAECEPQGIAGTGT